MLSDKPLFRSILDKNNHFEFQLSVGVLTGLSWVVLWLYVLWECSCGRTSLDSDCQDGPFTSLIPWQKCGHVALLESCDGWAISSTPLHVSPQHLSIKGDGPLNWHHYKSRHRSTFLGLSSVTDTVSFPLLEWVRVNVGLGYLAVWKLKAVVHWEQSLGNQLLKLPLTLP